MKKSAIIKIVSIVLVLCTLITLCIIPVGAIDTSNADLSSFLFHYPIDKFATRYVYSDGTKEVVSVYSTDLYKFFVDDSIKHGILVTPTTSPYYLDLVSFQSNIRNRELNNGDIVTFNLSFLAPFCDAMSFFIYFEDGTRQQFMFERSTVVFTNESMVVKYSGEQLAYGNKVYCHRYSLNQQIVSDGLDIIAVQIQVLHSVTNRSQYSWLYYEDCTYYTDRADSTENTGFFAIIGNIGRSIKDFFNMMFNFILDFGKKFKDSVSPLFDKVGTWISNAASNTWNFFKDGINSIGNGIKNLPSNISGFFTSLGDRISGFFDGISEGIYNWFSETFLGKVLRITNKTKEFIAVAGNDVQYAALDEVGDSTEEAAPDDWDMAPRPSFYVDVDYYNSLYPDLVGG